MIPNSGSQVLIAGGDLIKFLGESSTMTFLFTPSTQAFTLATGALNTPREEFELLPLDPKVVTGPLAGDVVAFGGIEANSAVCTNAYIVVTTLNTAEVYNPSTQTWSLAANTMGAKRAGLPTLFETGSLAGEAILPGGVDVEASTVTGSLTTADCVFTTSGLKQAATAETDLFEPDVETSGIYGTFVATGSLEQAREGPVQFQLTTGDQRERRDRDWRRLHQGLPQPVLMGDRNVDRRRDHHMRQQQGDHRLQRAVQPVGWDLVARAGRAVQRCRCGQ